MTRALRELRLNLISGLTVALISIPLSISLAIASGATPIMGIITSIWAGLVAAIFGGSAFNIVGAAGALSSILAGFALVHGAASLPMLAILSGALIYISYLFRLDRYLIFIPSSVMHGFTLGVGLTIGLGQINAAFGLTGLPVHESAVLNLITSFIHIAEMKSPAVALFFVTLCILFLLSRRIPHIPSAVIAAIFGIIVGYLSQIHIFPFTVQTLLSKYGEFHVQLIQVPVFTRSTFTVDILQTACTVAIVAILETLLSAKIADGMTNTRFNQRKEVLGLALANIASGLTGGLPATGVLARTALNAKSGAVSSVSAGLNTIFILLITLLLFRWFQYLPLAVVAGILVFAAIRMVEAKHFRKIYYFDRGSFWLAMLVASLTFGIDPLAGILIGVTISLLCFVQHLSRGQSELTLHKDCKLVARIPQHRLSEFPEDNDVVVYRFAGELTYFNIKSHEENLGKINAGTLILSLRNLFYIDLDALDVLKEIIEHNETKGIKVFISGAGEYITPLLEKTSWFVQMEKENKVFTSTTKALGALGFPQSVEQLRYI